MKNFWFVFILMMLIDISLAAAQSTEMNLTPTRIAAFEAGEGQTDVMNVANEDYTETNIPDRIENKSEKNRPNILIVYVDDLDHNKFGFMWNEIIQTPNIDRLAENGVVFRNAFATTATCITSRGNFMTGRYAARTGIYFDQFNELGEEHAEMIFPAQLRQVGYYTGYVGKWHFGPVPEGVFDNDQTFPGQGEFWSEEEPPDEGRYLTDRLGDQAVEMIREASAHQTFSYTVGFKAPHVQDGFHPVEPYPASPSTAVLYERDEIPAPPLSSPAFFESQPGFLQESLNRVR